MPATGLAEDLLPRPVSAARLGQRNGYCDRVARTRKPPEADDTPIGQLTSAVRQLTDEVRVLRDVLDEIREEYQHAVLNDRPAFRPVEPVRSITSVPVDPAAPDFAERVNRLTAADLPSQPREAQHDPQPGRQQDLW